MAGNLADHGGVRQTNAADAINPTDLPTFRQLASQAYIVANATTLAALDASLLGDGSRRRITTFKAWFFLDKSGTPRTAVPGLHIAASGGSGWWWVRETIPEPFWQAVTDWKISPATGNDENDGTTLPLQTHAELQRRRAGFPANSLTPTVITYLDDATEVPVVGTTTIAATVAAFSSERLVYTAAPIQSWPVSGANTIGVGEITLKNSATNTPNLLVDTTLPVSWTASGLVGKMVHFYSGATIVGTAHILEDIGSKTARLSDITDFTDLWSAGTGSPGTAVVGNTFRVFTHVSIPEPVAATSAGLVVLCHGLRVSVRGAGTTQRGSSGVGTTLFYNLCEFSGNGTWLNQSITCNTCYFNNGFNFINSSGSLTFCSTNGLVQFIGCARMNILQGFAAMGASAGLLFVDCSISTSFSYQLFDSALSGVSLRNSRISFTAAYMGTGNSGFLIEDITNNSHAAVNFPTQLTAITSANPTLALSIPNAPATRVTGVVADLPIWDDLTNSSITLGS